VILCALGIMISYADPWSGQVVRKVSACDFFQDGGFLEVLQTQLTSTKALFGFPMDNDNECLDDFRFPFRECLGSKLWTPKFGLVASASSPCL